MKLEQGVQEMPSKTARKPGLMASAKGIAHHTDRATANVADLTKSASSMAATMADKANQLSKFLADWFPNEKEVAGNADGVAGVVEMLKADTEAILTFASILERHLNGRMHTFSIRLDDPYLPQEDRERVNRSYEESVASFKATIKLFNSMSSEMSRIQHEISKKRHTDEKQAEEDSHPLNRLTNFLGIGGGKKEAKRRKTRTRMGPGPAQQQQQLSVCACCNKYIL
jgi:hypothetical protein